MATAPGAGQSEDTMREDVTTVPERPPDESTVAPTGDDQRPAAAVPNR
jgi:hypothetical protein